MTAKIPKDIQALKRFVKLMADRPLHERRAAIQWLWDRLVMEEQRKEMASGKGEA